MQRMVEADALLWPSSAHAGTPVLGSCTLMNEQSVASYLPAQRFVAFVVLLLLLSLP